MSAAELATLEGSGDLEPTDVIVWRDGTYSNQSVTLNSDSVVLMAESLGGVKFTGSSSLTINGEGARVRGFQWIDPSLVTSSIIYLGKDTTECIVEECVIDGTGLSADTSDSKWISLYGTKNTIRNCSFVNKMNMGTTLVVWFEDNKTPEHTIENNYFTRPYTHYDGSSAENGQEPIRIGTSTYSMSAGRCTVTGNHFYNCHGEIAEIISNKSCFNLYEGNLFDSSAGTLTLRHGNDCTIKGNYFTNDESIAKMGGVRVIGERHTVQDNYIENSTGSGYTSGICLVKGVEDSELNGYYQVQNALIDGNVLVSCAYGIVVNYNSYTMPVITTTISNNVVVAASTSAYTVYEYTDYPADVTYTNNTLYSGKQSGVTLETVATEPSYTRPTEAIAAVKAAAGASYY